MKIEFGLMSILSTVLFGALLILGGYPEIHSIDIDVDVSRSSLSIAVHPTFIFEMDTPKSFNGLCYGNVIIIDSKIPGTHKPRLLAHEARHLRHWRALGPWVWIAQYFLPLEPMHVDWNDAPIELAEMWNPPEWWPNQWSFVSIEL